MILDGNLRVILKFHLLAIFKTVHYSVVTIHRSSNLHKKWRFPWMISPVNATKSAEDLWKTKNILNKKSLMKNFFFSFKSCYKKNLQNLQENTCVWTFFKNRCRCKPDVFLWVFFRIQRHIQNPIQHLR